MDDLTVRAEKLSTALEQHPGKGVGLVPPRPGNGHNRGVAGHRSHPGRSSGGGQGDRPSPLPALCRRTRQGHDHGRSGVNRRPPRTQHQRATRVAGEIHGRDHPRKVRRRRKEHCRGHPEVGVARTDRVVRRVQPATRPRQEGRTDRLLRPPRDPARWSVEPPRDRRPGRGGEAHGLAETRACRPGGQSTSHAKCADGHPDRRGHPPGRAGPVPGSLAQAQLFRHHDRDRRAGVRPLLDWKPAWRTWSCAAG